MMTNKHLYPLHCSIQNYDWGKQGSASLVAQLAHNAVKEFKLDENEYYAELWMGTHPNGPAKLASSGEDLHKLISPSPSAHLGKTPAHSTSPAPSPNAYHIPFLFKILSMRKALPLQAHPDKSLGAQLHKRNKEEFVDDNHKPEIALAVKDGFRGFVGFRPVEEIAAFVEDVAELRQAIGDDEACDTFISQPSRDGVKRLFSSLLSQDQGKIAALVDSLVKRVKDQGAKVFAGVPDANNLAEVVGKIQQDYPGDVGMLAALFFMNLVELNRGESVYIGADEVHAYLEGDIIECMATSDNVVNAAFVPPEERDIKTFTSMLTYSARPASTYSLPGKVYKKSAKGRTKEYSPPLEEFSVLWTSFEGKGEEELAAVNGPTIAICVKGAVSLIAKGSASEKVELKGGSVVYVKKGTDVVLQSEKEADVYWAVCDV